MSCPGGEGGWLHPVSKWLTSSQQDRPSAGCWVEVRTRERVRAGSVVSVESLAVPCGMRKVLGGLWVVPGGSQSGQRRPPGKGGLRRMLRMSAGEEEPGKTPPQKEQGLRGWRTKDVLGKVQIVRTDYRTGFIGGTNSCQTHTEHQLNGGAVLDARDKGR